MPVQDSTEVLSAEEIAQLTIEQAVERRDIGAQPGPEDFEEGAEIFPTAFGPGLSKVRWVSNDSKAPDYAYLAEQADPSEFTLSGESLEALIALNRYEPYRERGVIAFGLRGARLLDGHEEEDVASVSLENVRPDHRHFRCVLGFYYPGTGKLSVYTGSTVPCRRGVWGYAHGGSASNMLPTGMHTYHVWRHKKIRPALRLAKSAEDPESGAAATVLRTARDSVYETTDPFDRSTPLDNVHCSYYTSENDYCGATFSSWGCLTVRGRKDPSHQWQKFQQHLSALGSRARVDLLLATGKDVALVSQAGNDAASVSGTMAALRRGSKGAAVQSLQEQLGMAGEDVDGDFGPETLDIFTARQRQLNYEAQRGRVADGIYSKAMDELTGWGILGAGV